MLTMTDIEAPITENRNDGNSIQRIIIIIIMNQLVNDLKYIIEYDEFNKMLSVKENDLM